MTATRGEILLSLLDQLNRFDDEIAHLLRSNRKQIAAAAEQVANSYAQFENSEERRRRLLRDNQSSFPDSSRE